MSQCIDTVDWSIYLESKEINGIVCTLVQFPTCVMWCRVVKRNVDVACFFDDIKPYFGLVSCGYVIMRRGTKKHALFSVGGTYPDDIPLTSIIPGNYTADMATQVRRVILFREIFAIGCTTENNIYIRDGNAISINENNSQCLTMSREYLSVLSEKLRTKWMEPFSVKEMVISVITRYMSISSYVAFLQTQVSTHSTTEKTAAILHHGVKRITEIAL